MSIIRVRVLLVPTKEQRQAFYDSAYYSDLMYNEALRWNIDLYDAEGKFYSYYAMQRMITQFKKEHPEFATVSANVLQDAVRNLRVALDRMQNGVSGFPRFKKIGEKSSFDITTYLLMYFVICPMVSGGLLFHQITDPITQALYIATFQAGWFIESMWSQTLVIHMIRTPKIPFLQSRASLPVILLTFTGIAVLTAIPFTSFGTMLGLAALPMVYFTWLAITIICYMALATLLKMLYVKRYGELL